MTPLGWKYAGMVWGYAFIWFVVTDPVKLLAYKVLDTVKSQDKLEAETAAAPEAKAEPQPEARAEPKPEAKAEPQPEAKNRASARCEAASTGNQARKLSRSRTAKAELATLLNTSLGDLLVAGLVKDPEDAGRLIAAAITQAEAPTAAAKAPEPRAEAQTAFKAGPKAKPEPDAKAKTPSDVTPQAAK